MPEVRPAASIAGALKGKAMCENSIDFRRGGAFPRLVLLGACPGQDEWNAAPQRPFAGQSGANLRSLLEVLRDLPNKGDFGLRAGDFNSLNLDDYTLMNSHAEAKWLAEHHRSTPRMLEVENQENSQRLTNQLMSVNARVVIGLGRPIADASLHQLARDSGPMRAIRILAHDHQHISFCIVGHPSPRAINRYGDGDPRGWFEGSLRRFPP